MASARMRQLCSLPSRHMKSNPKCMHLCVQPASSTPPTKLQPKRPFTFWSPSTAESSVSCCILGSRQLHTERPVYNSSSGRRFIGSQHDPLEVVSEPTRPDLADEGLADFRDTLHTLVTKSIESEDVGAVGEEDDDIFVSHSGRVLLFPWKRWNGGPDFPSDGVTGIPEKGRKAKLPSVTTILQKTMSPESALALLRWEKYMIKKMGFPAFQKLKQEMFTEGKKLHTNIGQVLLNKPEEVDTEDGIRGYWESIADCLPELASDATVLECHATHPFLGYHGYADCVTHYQGEPCVVEFKTSRKPKKTLGKCFDNPLQLAAYLGALNFDPRYQFKIKKALLAIAYKDGSPATFHVMDSDVCDVHWKKWLRRLQEYREMERRNGSKEADN